MNVSDDDLIRLLDGALDEARASEVRRAVDENPALQQALAQLQAARARLVELPAARPALSARVLDEIADPRSQRLGARRLWLAAPALAAAAIVLVVVRPGAGDDPVARGPNGGAQRGVAVVVRAGDPPTRVTADTPALASPLRLAIDVSVLPNASTAPRALAVWARDESGAVTWLRPAWTDATQPPACERIADDAGHFAAARGVELVAPAGSVVVSWVVRDADACDIRGLDERLERNLPLPDAAEAARLTVR